MRRRYGSAAVVAAALSVVLGGAVALAADVERITRGFDGSQANGRSELPATNADGTVIVFKSLAANLIESDQNGVIDVFVFDRYAGTIERVPRRPDTRLEPLEMSFPPVVSDDGRFVAFGSAATNLVRGDFNLFPDAYRYDRATETTRNLSLILEFNEGTLGGRVPDLPPSISADGRFVAFTSASPHIAGIDTNETHDVFVYDADDGTRELISSTRLGVPREQAADGLSGAGVLSPDGRYVAFCSGANNVTVGQPPSQQGIFLRDRAAGTTVHIASLGPQIEATSCLRRELMVAVSDDARAIAFTSFLALDPGDTNGAPDVYVWRADDSSISLVSTSVHGGAGNGASSFASISGDGRFVAFQSVATNLTDVSDDNGAADIFIADLVENRISRVTGLGGEHRSGDSFAPAISRDGTVVVFQSEAAFTPDDSNGLSDIFALVNELSFTPTPTHTLPPTLTPTPTTPPTATLAPATPTPTPTATGGATATATASATSTADGSGTPTFAPTTGTPNGSGSSTPTPTATGGGAGATATVTGTAIGTPRGRVGDDDGCGCRIDPETGRATSSLPLLGLAFPALLLAARRRRELGPAREV